MMEADRYAQALRADYALFVADLTARYLAAQAIGRGVGAVSELRIAGLRAIDALLQRADTATRDYLAHLGLGTPLTERSSTWLSTLRAVATKNLNDLIVKLMGGTLRPADLLNRAAGAVGLLLQQRLAAPRLTVRDRRGRAWLAETYVGTTARDFAYQAYLDATIERLDADGVELVDIVYPDPAHEHHGLTIRLDELPLVRASIFHPNASARLVPHVQA